jgi:hypothetical protein
MYGEALRASVGSTEASDGRLARFGVIDRGNVGPINFGGVGQMRVSEKNGDSTRS